MATRSRQSARPNTQNALGQGQPAHKSDVLVFVEAAQKDVCGIRHAQKVAQRGDPDDPPGPIRA